ncbi:hypothetical protein [Kitasatospora sp. DSM 101779]|uniref:hypothetical protein n=1 Tax=Kitasatospora sp. DSM 101779 TaxID=2853165 RepID=UPI0021DA4CC1|nr:hypothetical protein [Kitasatospora sp. DSM 101779]MCU7826234.1 hypothetical protein [Kitasatospora sp. DSM 101779]
MSDEQGGRPRRVHGRSRRVLGEAVLELVGGLVLAGLTTASLAGTVVGAGRLYGRSPLAAWSLAAVGAAVAVYGLLQRRRPKERRTRVGRVCSGLVGALGAWLGLCVCYASYDVLF